MQCSNVRGDIARGIECESQAVSNLGLSVLVSRLPGDDVAEENDDSILNFIEAFGDGGDQLTAGFVTVQKSS